MAANGLQPPSLQQHQVAPAAPALGPQIHREELLFRFPKNRLIAHLCLSLKTRSLGPGWEAGTGWELGYLRSAGVGALRAQRLRVREDGSPEGNWGADTKIGRN